MFILWLSVLFGGITLAVEFILGFRPFALELWGKRVFFSKVGLSLTLAVKFFVGFFITSMNDNLLKQSKQKGFGVREARSSENSP